MVLLTLTPAAKNAVEEYCESKRSPNEDDDENELEVKLEKLSKLEAGSPIDHHDLTEVSNFLVQQSRDENDGNGVAREWRLDTLLRGAIVYQPPPPPKPEPTSEYKALMKRLRQEEEERQYNLMLNPPPPLEAFNQRFPNGPSTGTQRFSAGAGAPPDEDDEVTYADINRQMALIINVLVSIIACSVSIWIAARRWEVPQRLALSMTGSGLVAAAEVVIYFGYIRRIKDAKVKERGMVERKEVMETWVLDGKGGTKAEGDGSVRFRKGKHR